MRISDWSSDVCSSDLQRLAERDDAGLGRGIVRLPRVAGDADDRSDVDDAALARLHHPAQHRLAGAEHAAAVGVEDRSAARRVGKECVRTDRSRCWPFYLKNTIITVLN